MVSLPLFVFVLKKGIECSLNMKSRRIPSSGFPIQEKFLKNGATSSEAVDEDRIDLKEFSIFKGNDEAVGKLPCL